MGEQPRLVGRRVLIVEDDYYLASEASTMLQEEGAAVLGPCPTADAGYALAEAEAPDCALLDINLGDGADFHLARRLQSLSVPIVFLTGYDREIVPPDLMSIELVEKPTEFSRLINAVRRLLPRPPLSDRDLL